MKSKIVGTIFLIWFVCSIVLIFLVSNFENQIGWLLLIFGQYFVVFGGIAVFGNMGAKHFPSIVLMGPLVGLVCAVCGIYTLVYGEAAIDTIYSIAPYLIFLIFPISGILLIHMSLSEILYLKKKCTYEIDAKCVDVSVSFLKNNRGRMVNTYMPTYNVHINGKDHRIWNNKYSTNKFVVGEYYKIMINPLDVNDFIDSNTKFVEGNGIIIGFIFMIVSIIMGALMFIAR